MGYVADNLVGLCLAHMKFILISAAFLEQFHKGFHGEGIVLRRYAETLFAFVLSHITFFDQAGLFQHLSCIA